MKDVDREIVIGIEEPSGIGLAISLLLVLILFIGAFVWFVVRFDPATSDFIDSSSPVATATGDLDIN